MIIVILSFFISAILVEFMLPRILVLSLRKKLIDPIDKRKVHRVPASRLGGVTFFPAILFTVWFCTIFSHFFTPLGTEVAVRVKTISECLALLILFMVGMYDDIVGVPYRSKFAAQIFAALIIISSGAFLKSFHGFCGVEDIPAYIGVPITLFLYIFVINAINLIDGIDGLASLLSIMALGVYSVLLYNQGMVSDYMVSMSALGVLAPFCYRNIFGIKKGLTSKIFMGDTGALVIGAILCFTAVSIWNIPAETIESRRSDQVYYMLAFTMLLVPCFDVIRLVIERYFNKKPLFLPDKNHIHHKYMALGYSPRRAMLRIVTINFVFMILNLALAYLVNITYIIVIDILVWTVMHLYISKKIKEKKENEKNRSNIVDSPAVLVCNQPQD